MDMEQPEQSSVTELTNLENQSNEPTTSVLVSPELPKIAEEASIGNSSVSLTGG